MRNRSSTSLLVILAIGLMAAATPPLSFAKSGNAPPGNSGIDEYVEAVPSPSGDRPTEPSGGSSTGSGNGSGPTGDGGTAGPPLTQAQRDALLARGPDGASVVNAIEATKGNGGGSTAGGGGGKGGSAAGGGARDPSSRASVPAERGESGLSAVWGALTGTPGEGMGALLPVLLIVTALLGLGVAAQRRRRRSS